jgi:hypothetical protein
MIGTRVSEAGRLLGDIYDAGEEPGQSLTLISQVEWGLEACENQVAQSSELGNVNLPLLSAMIEWPFSPDGVLNPSRTQRQCSYDRECSRRSK